MTAEVISIEPEPTYADRLRAALVDTTGLDDLPDPEPLVDDFLFRDSINWLQGKSGDGKSFVALDVAGCVATGVPWQGRLTTDGGEPVLYLVAEGVTGMRKRVRAWEHAMGGPMLGVTFLPMAVQAAESYHWESLIEVAAELRPALIVLDTQARITVGLDENSAQDMGRFVEAAERLRRATKAAVLVVHHEGRVGEWMRGSTALFGAATTVIRAVKDDLVITVQCPKQKDAPEFDDFELRMVPTLDSIVLMVNDRRRTGTSRAAIKTANLWWELFNGDQVSSTKLQAATGVAERTLYRHLSELTEAGMAMKLQSGRTTYYRLITEPDA